MKQELKLDLEQLEDTSNELLLVIDSLEQMYGHLSEVRQNLESNLAGQFTTQLTTDLIPKLSKDIDYLAQNIQRNLEYLLATNYEVVNLIGPNGPIEIDLSLLSTWALSLKQLVDDIQHIGNNPVFDQVSVEYQKMRSKLELEISTCRKSGDYHLLQLNEDICQDLDYNFQVYNEVYTDFIRVNLSNNLSNIQGQLIKIKDLYHLDQEFTIHDILKQKSEIEYFTLARFGEKFMEYKIEDEILNTKVYQGVDICKVQTLVSSDTKAIKHQVKLRELKQLTSKNT